MAKRKWWQYVLFFLKVGAQAVEEGEIGAGKKTAKAGKVAGEIVDAVTAATEETPDAKVD